MTLELCGHSTLARGSYKVDGLGQAPKPGLASARRSEHQTFENAFTRTLGPLPFIAQEPNRGRKAPRASSNVADGLIRTGYAQQADRRRKASRP